MNYLTRVSLAFSQAFNAIVLLGNHGESVSGRTYRMVKTKQSNGWIHLESCINSIAFWSDNHCRDAHQLDVQSSEGFLKRYKHFYDIMALRLVGDIENTMKGLQRALNRLDTNEEEDNDIRRGSDSSGN